MMTKNNKIGEEMKFILNLSDGSEGFQPDVIIEFTGIKKLIPVLYKCKACLDDNDTLECIAVIPGSDSEISPVIHQGHKC